MALAGCVVVSYIAITLSEIWFVADSPESTVVAIGAAVVAGFIAALLEQYEVAARTIGRIKKLPRVYRAGYSDIWYSLRDCKCGVTLRVFLPSEKVMYVGSLRKYES